MIYDKAELLENLTTWVYEEGSFVPTAKIVGNEKYSIINDYIGRPVQVYDENGNVVWETDYDIYGGLKSLKGDRGFIPFRQLGQYEDQETGLYYNRFRYYSSDTGIYLSQDPIGLEGNNPNIYAYVADCNSWVDIFGLNLINGIPQNPGTVRRFMSKAEYKDFKKNGFKYDPTDSRGGISTTSTKIKPKNPDSIKNSTGALGADYYVDINVSNKNVELKGMTKGGVPDWKVKDDILVDTYDKKGRLVQEGDIVGSGKVKCK